MEALKKILKYAPEKQLNVGLSIIFSAISAVLIVLPFYFFYKVLYALTVDKNPELGLKYSLIIILLMLIRLITYILSLVISHLLAFRVETNMKKTGLEKLLSASFSFFDMNQSGKIRKLIDDNTEETHNIVAHLIPDTTVAVVLPILLIAVMFVVNYRLGIFITVITLLAMLLVKGMMGDREFMKLYNESLEKMNAETVEYVRGMQVVKIFNTGIENFNSLFKCISDYSRLAFNYTISCRVPYISFQVIFMMFTAFTVPFAIHYLHKGANADIVLVNVIFFACFAGLMFGAFMKIMFIGMYYEKANMAVTKLEKLFVEMENKKFVPGTVDDMSSTDIEFDNVSFSYVENQPILNSLSFSLKGNRTYALVGSSGSGKSTIAKLISGFYAIDSGQIKIGGRDIREYSNEALLSNISFVFQNSKLFKTSIFENVKMGNENADKEEVMAALSAARCDDILAKFEKGADTVIGSKGVYLSGGEVQRIAIARAILKNAGIIILDEASAAADPENEYEIQQAFSNLMKNKTVIMIAHRLSSIRNVDEILVIDDGKIIERGNDKELMAQNGRYRQLQELFSKANDWRVR